VNRGLDSKASASRRIQTQEMLAVQDRFYSDITGNSFVQAAGFQFELLFAMLSVFSWSVLALVSR